jgi:hypothetical protein
VAALADAWSIAPAAAGGRGEELAEAGRKDCSPRTIPLEPAKFRDAQHGQRRRAARENPAVTAEDLARPFFAHLLPRYDALCVCGICAAREKRLAQASTGENDARIYPRSGLVDPLRYSDTRQNAA